MTWLYIPNVPCESSPSAPGSQASNLESASPAHRLEQYATWRGKARLLQFWLRAWRTVPWLRRLSGLESSPLTATLGVGQWISSVRDSPANLGPLRGAGSEPTTTAGSGPRLPASSAKSSRPPSSLRTCLAFYEEGDWWTPQADLFCARGSAPYLGPWPTSGSMRSGDVFQQADWAPPTFASDSSSWPTAAARDHRSGANVTCWRNSRPLNEIAESWATPTNSMATPEDLAQAKFAGNGGKRPSYSEAWPTPQAADAERGSDSLFRSSGNPTLGGMARLTAGKSLWDTPKADIEKSGNPREGDRGDLQAQTRMWETPRGLSFAESHQPGQDGLGVQVRSWATPIAKDGDSTGATTNHRDLKREATTWATPLGRDGSGAGHSSNDRDLQREVKNWPSPNVSSIDNRKGASPTSGDGIQTAAKAWATPDASVGTGYNQSASPGASIRPQLAAQAASCGPPDPTTGNSGEESTPVTGPRSQLNPAFVEWLMGYPDGWTGSGPSETEWSLWWSQWRSVVLRYVP